LSSRKKLHPHQTVPSGGFAVRALPAPHADPFDCLLIAQAKLGGLTIVTDDQAIRGYAVDVLW
jgi:PIN domain nuclease of toxin-antitoxin system